VCVGGGGGGAWAATRTHTSVGARRVVGHGTAVAHSRQSLIAFRRRRFWPDSNGSEWHSRDGMSAVARSNPLHGRCSLNRVQVFIPLKVHWVSHNLECNGADERIRALLRPCSSGSHPYIAKVKGSARHKKNPPLHGITISRKAHALLWCCPASSCNQVV
jgi:hypothetical protein